MLTLSPESAGRGARARRSRNGVVAMAMAWTEQPTADPLARSPRARDKITSVDGIATVAERWRAAGQRVVLAHGVFDLLHMGHVRHLEAAKAEGDLLVVTLTADRHVNKGPGRPVFPEPVSYTHLTLPTNREV